MGDHDIDFCGKGRFLQCLPAGPKFPLTPGVVGGLEDRESRTPFFVSRAALDQCIVDPGIRIIGRNLRCRLSGNDIQVLRGQHPKIEGIGRKTPRFRQRGLQRGDITAYQAIFLRPKNRRIRGIEKTPNIYHGPVTPLYPAFPHSLDNSGTIQIAVAVRNQFIQYRVVNLG